MSEDGGRTSSEPLFVVVSGPPASGKSAIAPVLARSLALPLIAKDEIKGVLMSTLGVTDLEDSRRLGRVAVAVMYALASSSPIGAVLESSLVRSVAAHELDRLDGTVVEVFCRCDRHTAQIRFRARSGSRAAGHFDDQRSDDDIWNDEIAEPVAGGWPVIEIDTNQPVDPGDLIVRVRAAAALGLRSKDR